MATTFHSQPLDQSSHLIHILAYLLALKAIIFHKGSDCSFSGLQRAFDRFSEALVKGALTKFNLNLFIV